MNVVTSYTKNQLDRSAYVSEDKYKRAFDLNRIRLATQKLAGVENKYAYYYNLYMFQNLVAKLNKLGINVSAKVTPDLSNYILDDERQIEIAEETWGKELIDEIIDVVISDGDLGDYEEPKTEEEIKKEAESDASSDSDSGVYLMPPFDRDKEGEKPSPIQEKLEEEAKDKTEEISKGAEIGEECDLGNMFCTGDDICNVCNEECDFCEEVSCVIEYGDCASDTAHEACVISCTGNAYDGTTYYGCANVCIDGRECDCMGDQAGLCDYTPPCDEEPCDTPACDEPCDSCAGGDCCVSDVPCADIAPCDTCGAGDYEPPPCDTCSGDSGGCPADCCVSDCCVGDGGCASGDTCGNCDCCVSDSACTNVSCGGDMSCGSDCDCDCASDCGSNCDGASCDCGSDCDNYGDCIDACGGNNE